MKNDHDEPMQELQITMKFPVKMFPGSEHHLQQVALAHLTPKGIKCFIEDDRVIII